MFNPKEKRLRAGWRILFFLFLFLSMSSLALAVKPLFGDLTKRAFTENYSIVIIAILAVSATASTLLSRKWLDKRTIVSLGLAWNKQALKDLFFGFLFSFAMAAAFFFLLLALGLIEFQEFDFQGIAGREPFDFVEFMSVLTLGSLGVMLLETILVGYWEELVFRGYLLQNMIDGMGLWISIIISCIFYGLIHFTNPNATLLSSTIIIGFGFLRIYGFLTTKMLWLSMGMHIGWNFFQGPVFGFAASGHKKATLLKHTFTSDKDYLTGGAFGPEGSILIIPILILAIIAIKWYADRNYGLQTITAVGRG